MVINFISIPRRYNQIANTFAGRGAHYNPTHYKRGALRVKVQCRPSVPDAANFWQVFNFDEHIMNFLLDEIVAHTFSIQELLDYLQESDVIQIKNNVIPKGLLSFERMFDSKYVQKAKYLTIQKENYVELKIEPSKYIKVGLECSDEEKAIVSEIYHEFSKVIAWTYDNLNTYDKSVIQHIIKHEPNAKPYRQK